MLGLHLLQFVGCLLLLFLAICTFIIFQLQLPNSRPNPTEWVWFILVFGLLVCHVLGCCWSVLLDAICWVGQCSNLENMALVLFVLCWFSMAAIMLECCWTPCLMPNRSMTWVGATRGSITERCINSLGTIMAHCVHKMRSRQLSAIFLLGSFLRVHWNPCFTSAPRRWIFETLGACRFFGFTINYHLRF